MDLIDLRREVRGDREVLNMDYFFFIWVILIIHNLISLKGII